MKDKLFMVSAIGSTVLMASSAIVGAIAIGSLFLFSPFIPDGHELKIKEFIAYPAAGFGISILWVSATMQVGHRAASRAAQAPAQFTNESGLYVPRTAVEVGECREGLKSIGGIYQRCSNCRYFIDDSAAVWLDHPCAVHPSGRPSGVCRDWKSRA